MAFEWLAPILTPAALRSVQADGRPVITLFLVIFGLSVFGVLIWILPMEDDMTIKRIIATFMLYRQAQSRSSLRRNHSDRHWSPFDSPRRVVCLAGGLKDGSDLLILVANGVDRPPRSTRVSYL
ncbi:unnamed protein product [Alternaria burnsii]|nr:unnamed protein product [Alternaria burnsii]